jgi:hypothetical protein
MTETGSVRKQLQHDTGPHQPCMRCGLRFLPNKPR